MQPPVRGDGGHICFNRISYLAVAKTAAPSASLWRFQFIAGAGS
jgi:hypothetical protein